MGKFSLKPFTEEVAGLGHDYPPWPAQLGIYDQITHEVIFHKAPFSPTGEHSASQAVQPSSQRIWDKSKNFIETQKRQ